MNQLTEELREKLANMEHIQWMAWAAALEQVEQLSTDRLERWHKFYKPYEELSEKEKEQYRTWADKVLEVLDSMSMEFVDREAKLPDNKVWHKVDREFEAYCAGRNDMVRANWNKTEKVEK